MCPDREPSPLRVGLIGHGSIGGPVADALREHRVPGCRLAGVLHRSSTEADLDDLIAASDLIVEAAGHGSVAAYGPAVVRAGVDLLVVSVGALIDDQLFSTLRTNGPGRLLISTGAIGGLELLRAAALLGPLDAVTLETTKPPRALMQPWMDDDLVQRVKEGRERVRIFDGTAREAARLFPQSTNVAATLALGTVGLDTVRVTVVADPSATGVRHRISASGPAGRYAIDIENEASPTNPRTSGITPYAVLRALRDLRADTVVGF